MAEIGYSIFFSWQSDLPNSETRGLIQSSIDAAVKGLRDTVFVEADRDTKGVYGSPDIVQTIFKKIDECDVFIADVSAVSVYSPLDKEGNPTERIKASPNPNVLLELGYAIQSVGWENIICVMNDDYNKNGEIPFDLAHHRLMRFSLKDTEKADVRRELRDIISSTVLNLMENGKRVRSNFSNIIVGSICTENKKVSPKLIPLNVYMSASVENKNAELRNTGELLVKKIMEITPAPVCREVNVDPSVDIAEPEETIVTKDGQVLTPVRSNWKLDLFKSVPISVKETDKSFMCDGIKKWFGIEISDTFFEFGGLTKKNVFGIQPTYELEGTVEEKDKYNKYVELGAIIAQLDMLEMYLKTFDDYALLPLAIENVSDISDSEIKVFVEVNSETAQVIVPTAEIINPDLKGVEGLIYEDDLIKTVLLMNEGTDICYDTDLSFSLYETQQELRARLKSGGINGTPYYDEEDYAREIAKYIATPMDGSKDTFFFEISALHAKEKKWLGPLIMVRPITDNIELSYTIKSKSSDGTLSGKLTK